MEKTDYIIRLERENEYSVVENLVRESFWNVYKPGCLEHYVLHLLRKNADFVPQLDYVMEKDGKLIGQAAYCKAYVQTDDGKELPIMTMGPICIAPEFKRQGYGKKLLDYTLEKARLMGVGAVCFEGNIDFYGKSGFVVASTKGIHYHGEPRENEVPYFLLKELKEGYFDGVSGVYHTPQVYYVDEKEAEKFDESFPHKEKLKLEGQLFN